MVARALYLGYFSHERRLPPLAHHHDQRVMGGDIDRHHGGGLTWDKHYPPASDGYLAVMEATRLIFYSSLLI